MPDELEDMLEGPDKDMNRISPVADQADVLALEVDSVIPGCAVQELSFIVLEARDCWIPPVVQDTAGVDQDIALVIDYGSSAYVFDLYVPLSTRVVPASIDDFVICLTILIQSILCLEVIKVLINFSGCCVDT